MELQTNMVVSAKQHCQIIYWEKIIPFCQQFHGSLFSGFGSIISWDWSRMLLGIKSSMSHYQSQRMMNMFYGGMKHQTGHSELRYFCHGNSLICLMLVTASTIHYSHALLFSIMDRFYPFPSGLFHCHWGNHMIAPVTGAIIWLPQCQLSCPERYWLLHYIAIWAS